MSDADAMIYGMIAALKTRLAVVDQQMRLLGELFPDCPAACEPMNTCGHANKEVIARGPYDQDTFWCPDCGSYYQPFEKKWHEPTPLRPDKLDTRLPSTDPRPAERMQSEM